MLSGTIYAQKEEMRNWIYIGDLIKAIDSVLENVDFSITLNIGGVKSTSMYELYQIILEILGIEKKHTINPSNPFRKIHFQERLIVIFQLNILVNTILLP